MKKPLLYGLIAVALCVYLLSYIVSVPKNTSQTTDTNSQSQTTNTSVATTTQKQSELATKPKTSPSKTASRATTSSAAPTQNADIIFTLNVRTKTFFGTIRQGSTVFDMMSQLASTTDFRFHAINYPGMGYFVDRINSTQNTFDKFWVYYINDTKANVGISSYILKANDRITWKFEDSNGKEFANN